MSKKFLRLISLCLMVSLVVGCATQRPSSQLVSGEKILQGRFVLEFTQNMRRHREQGKFLWVHSVGQTKLEIFSPFGQTQARLEIHSGEGSDVQSVLYTRGQAPRYADKPEILIQQLLGFSLPVQAFTVWIEGQPAVTESAQIIRDQQGRITSIQQLDWIIDYQPYAVAIPRQIILRHAVRDLCTTRRTRQDQGGRSAESGVYTAVHEHFERRPTQRLVGAVSCAEVSTQDLLLRLIIDS